MTTQRIFCIGRNYVEHVRELGNEEGDPVIFMKPVTSLVTTDTAELPLPADGDLDYETELVVESSSSMMPVSVVRASNSDL